MPHFDTRFVGNGPKQTAMWLDGTPCIVKGLDRWPKVGECLFTIDFSTRPPHRPGQTKHLRTDISDADGP